MQQALAEQGLESGSSTEMESLIKEHVQNQLEEGMFSQQTQKTNLEESNQLDLEQDVSTTRTS